MKKVLFYLLILMLAPLMGGCGMFMPPKVYGGQDSYNDYYNAHPDLNNAPDYMRPHDD